MGSFVRGLLFAAAWVASFLLAWFQSGEASWFLFEALSGAALVAVWLRFGTLLRLEAQHELSAERIVEGDELAVSVTLRHRSLAPVPWLVMEEAWQRTGEAEPRLFRKLLFPWFRGTLEYRYTLTGLPRGEYRLAGVTAVSGDGFGLLSRSRKIAAPQAERGARFVAYPAELPVRLTRGAASPEDGRPLPGAAMPGGYPAGIRDYAAGDPLSRIHWKASAKRGTLAVKETEPGESQRLLLLLDSSAETYAELGGGGADALEASVRAAAGVVRAARGRGWPLGFACSHAGAYRLGYADLRHAHASPLTELLARIDGAGSLRFADVVAGETALAPAGTLLAVVTPRPGDALLAALRGLRRRSPGVLLIVPHAKPILAPRERERLKAFRELGCEVLAVPPQPAAAAQGGAVRVGT